jgi:hypothetical protein
VYYPRLDTPSVRNLDFVVTDGRALQYEPRARPLPRGL